MEIISIRPAGDTGIVVDLGDRIDIATNRRVHALATQLKETLAPYLPVDVLPGYVSLLVTYDPMTLTYEAVVRAIREASTAEVREPKTVRRFRLPVAYGGEYGPDLEDVARYHDVSSAKVVEEHTGRDYPIFCLGFSPGFPLLGGLSESLHTPRLETPRPRVPAGSVAIGGAQTGVYPTDTPGGWRLIGRTPLVLFNVDHHPPVPYQAGDVIRFEPIDAAEYDRLHTMGRMPEGESIPPPYLAP